MEALPAPSATRGPKVKSRLSLDSQNKVVEWCALLNRQAKEWHYCREEKEIHKEV